MNFKSKNLLLLFAIATITSLCLSSCQKYDCKDEKADFGDICDDGVATTGDDIIQTDCTCAGTSGLISGNITSNVTLTADEEYTLRGRVIVTNGATLTIEPGTIIKAEDQPNDQASVLIIATDGKIEANGTASSPIIFTSVADNIGIGQLTGSNLGETDTGLWGGVIILGLAPISPQVGATDRIEGIPPNVDQAVYGGSESAHSSGRFTYVSIRHAGIALEPDKEINGLTLGGVGSGTVINHVEVVSNFDDGIELFGGTVNVSDAVVLYQGDDAFDIDQAYAGTLENIVYIGSAANESDNALEIDGPEGAENAEGAFTISKGSLHGPSDDYAHLKSNAQGLVQDLYFTGFPESTNLEVLGGSATSNFLDGSLVVKGCVFNDGRTLEEICATDQNGEDDDDGNPTMDLQADIDAAFIASPGNAISSMPAVSANLDAFAGWSYADITDALDVFQ